MNTQKEAHFCITFKKKRTKGLINGIKGQHFNNLPIQAVFVQYKRSHLNINNVSLYPIVIYLLKNTQGCLLIKISVTSLVHMRLKK